MTTGAYTLASRAPNWLRRAGVATTRSDPSGSPADVPSTSSLPAATPLACSAAHMAGSQATIALGLTCAAIHRAAAVLAAVAACSEAGICEPAGSPGRPAAAGDAVVVADDDRRDRGRDREHGAGDEREQPPAGYLQAGDRVPVAPTTGPWSR